MSKRHIIASDGCIFCGADDRKPGVRTVGTSCPGQLEGERCGTCGVRGGGHADGTAACSGVAGQPSLFATGTP